MKKKMNEYQEKKTNDSTIIVHKKKKKMNEYQERRNERFYYNRSQ